MTPAELVELDEIADLVDKHRYYPALDKLKKLAAVYPDNPKLKEFITVCETEIRRNSMKTDDTFNFKKYVSENAKKQDLQEVVVSFKNPGLLALALFLVIVVAIVVAYLIIFYFFKLTITVRPGLILDYLIGLMLTL